MHHGQNKVSYHKHMVNFPTNNDYTSSSLYGGAYNRTPIVSLKFLGSL